jgi:hypothetical protein
LIFSALDIIFSIVQKPYYKYILLHPINKILSNIDRRKLLIALILIPIGLFTKYYFGIGHEFVCNSLGGVIYVIFFILLSSLIFSKESPAKLSVLVLCITGLLEFSQLIHTGLLDKFRTNFLFRALFGSVFNVFDFLYYIVGALLGFGILKMLYKRNEV